MITTEGRKNKKQYPTCILSENSFDILQQMDVNNLLSLVATQIENYAGDIRGIGLEDRTYVETRRAEKIDNCLVKYAEILNGVLNAINAYS